MSRTAVVTGGARGIGAAIAAALAAQDDEVVVLDVIDAPEAIPGVRYVTCDVSDEASVTAAFAQVNAVDVLVNNAGVARQGLIGVQPLQEWTQIVSINLTGTFLCCSAAIPRMREGGAIVSISSTAAFVGLAGRGAYGATKAGILALTRALAVELAPRRIRANAVCPGFTRTEIIARGIADGAYDEPTMLERVPTGRLAETDDIARAVRFLAGEDASYITGQSLIVDGGWTIQGMSQAPDWLTHKG